MPEAEADPPLVAAWLAARSISRHLPVPVPDHGGLRVDTGSETESCRYVFARPVSGLSGLGRTVRDPLTALKLCAGSELMRSMLSPRWDVVRRLAPFSAMRRYADRRVVDAHL